VIKVKNKSYSKIVLYISAIFIIIIMLFPLYWMFKISLSPSLFGERGSIWINNFNLEAYKKVFSNPLLGKWLFNSVYVTALTLIITIPVSILAGYALSRLRSKEVTFSGSLLLLVQMLPITLLTIPLYVLFAKINLINNLIALVLANTAFCLPFCSWMLKAYFDGLPVELEEAAQVDGCGLWESFFKVIIPLSKPGIGAVSMYTMMLSWGEFIFARTLMTKPSNYTVGVAVVSFRDQYAIQWNETMAASLIFVVPLLIAFFFLEKYLVKGLTGGALK